ncbi:hypothetical protein JTE90_011665, partial [Oedothorax gibbosus]
KAYSFNRLYYSFGFHSEGYLITVSAFIRATPAMDTYFIFILLLCMMPYTLAFILPIRGITEEALHNPRTQSKANAHVRRRLLAGVDGGLIKGPGHAERFEAEYLGTSAHTNYEKVV